MITSEGFFDWAKGIDPPTDNRLSFFGGKRHAFDVTVHHSLEGWYTGPGGYSAHRDPSRYPTCWHGTVKKDGTFWQHAPIWLQTVHSHAANPRGPGIESEGVATPLTPAQVATWQRIHADIAAYTGIEWRRETDYVKGMTGAWIEHRQVGPTACPSERYAPLWAAVEDDMGMTAEQEALLNKVILALASGSEEGGLDEATRLTNATFRVDRVAAGLDPSALDQARSAQARVTAHEENHGIQGDHGHKTRTEKGVFGDYVVVDGPVPLT